MVIFVANRENLQTRRLHERVAQRLRATFTEVRLRRVETHEPGSYRAVGTVDPRAYLDDETYPATVARVEVGFSLRTGQPEHYWCNWTEPRRALLVGWHQDDTHDDLGPVHRQVNDGSTVAERGPATFIDAHPLGVLDRRLATLPDLVTTVEWAEKRPVGFDTASLTEG